MEQTREAMTQNLAERLCWQVARRDDARVARRLYRKQVVDGVYRLDEGAVLDDFFYFLHELGVVDLLGQVQGTAVQRKMVPCVQYLLLYSLKTLFGVDRMICLAALAVSDEALMRLWVQCAAGAAGGVPAGRRATPGAAHDGAHLPGYAGGQHRAAERAGPGGLVQRRHSGPGQGWGVCRATDGHRRCYRSGDDGPV